jgi:serralysin
MRLKTTLAAAAVGALICASPAAADVIQGTDGDDDLVGKHGQDLIYGFDGDDKIDGGRGSDDLYGGAGDDELWPGRGERVGWWQFNSMHAEEGNDVVHAGPSSSDSDGGPGNDVMMGGQSYDYMEGGDGDDKLRPGRHGDAVQPNFGADVVRLGSGMDFVYLTVDPVEPGDSQGSVDRVWCGHGNDYVMFGGKAFDQADVIADNCEDGNYRFGVSRDEFLERASRALRGDHR